MGRALGCCPHGHDCKSMRLGMATQRAVPDKKGIVRCDVEGMAEQAVVHCASSQGESTEQCRAWPLVACST